jgi:hypothetical protein
VEVIVDDDTGRVYVRRKPTPDGVKPKSTHQYRKFGLTMVWDGHGELLGVLFSGTGRDIIDIKTMGSIPETAEELITLVRLFPARTPRGANPD